ncbi:MAG: metal-dependent hydrolase [Bacillaceae bacterium]
MDSATHIVMGVTLGALATLDPTLATIPAVPEGIILATVLGSTAPDIDTIFKLNNNAQYIRNHRGRTHSVPAVILWTILITFVVHLFFSTIPFFHLLFWTFFAVFLHVFTDVFNAYGTQALRPFSNKWIAFGIIGTFDITIFTIHAGAIALFFLLSVSIGKIALYAYLLTIIYYFIRLKMHYDVKRRIKILVPTARVINVTPAVHPLKYHVAAICKHETYIIKVHYKKINIVDAFIPKPLPNNEIMNAALKDRNVIAFLTFSPHYQYDITRYTNHTEVRFMDLRYYSDNRYPFVAIVQLDDNFKIIDSYTGWVFKEQKLRKKLKLKPK